MNNDQVNDSVKQAAGKVLERTGAVITQLGATDQEHPQAAEGTTQQAAVDLQGLEKDGRPK